MAGDDGAPHVSAKRQTDPFTIGQFDRWPVLGGGLAFAACDEPMCALRHIHQEASGARDPQMH